MTIDAKIIAHSSHPGCPDLYTVQARYPRFIHAESKTHRLLNIDDATYEIVQDISLMEDRNLCRNASSSRAIPVERMICEVLDDPAMPVSWGRNQRGMQADVDLRPGQQALARTTWLEARDAAVKAARDFIDLGLHKQAANRVLEPFAHITVIITATEWDNFFDLRCHPAADPTMRALAEKIHEVMRTSTPTPVEWWGHLPYVTADDPESLPLARISAARCARVSYLNHDGSAPDPQKDMALAQRLLDERHMSPFEHQARPAPGERHGPLVGWKHQRAVLEEES